MLWIIISLICLLALTLLSALFFLSKKFSDITNNLLRQLNEQPASIKSLMEVQSNYVTELLNQQKDLLNRLQTHNWTEYSQLAASVVNPFQGPPERINPDDLYANDQFDEAMDHWGDFEPPNRFEDAEAAIKGLMGNVPT